MVFSKILSKPGIAGNPNLILSFSIYSYPEKMIQSTLQNSIKNEADLFT